MYRVIFTALALAAGARAQISIGIPLPGSGSTTAAAATTTAAATTALPPWLTPIASPYTLKSLPAACTGEATTYQDGFWAQDSVIIEDVPGLWGSKDPVGWTFSTNASDIIFSTPAFPNSVGDGIKPNVTNGTDGHSFMVYMSGVDQGQVMEWEASKSNKPGVGGSNMSTFNQPLARDTNQLRARDTLTYYLQITADMPCAHPQGNSSCSTNDIERSADAWSAYGVDDWLSSWIQNNSASFASSGGMFQKFVNDFAIGGGKSCTIEQQCQLVVNCNDLPHNGTQANAPQVYLVLIALQNLSDLFNQFYNSLNIGQGDTMTQIAQLSMQFHYLNGTATNSGPSQAALASGGLGLASSVLGFIPGLSDLTPFLGIINSILGLANSASSKTSSFTFPDTQLAANEATISEYLGQYVQSMRKTLEDTYTGIFADGTNLTQALTAGQVVNRTVINLDCDSCVSTSEINFEQYLAFKMVNEMWWQQNAFITFMPYGNITQVDTWDTTTFSESDCASNFLTTDDERLRTICHQTDGDDFGTFPTSFLGPGMARLNWYWPGDPLTTGIGDPYGTWGSMNISRGPPGYNDFNTSNPVFNPSNGSSSSFQVTDIIASSVAGFIKGGFNFDGVANAGQQVIDDPTSLATLDTLKSMKTFAASTPGMFSIPVCVLTDLNAWPTYWSTYNRVGGDYYSPCYGSSDRYGNLFEDFISPDLRTIVTEKLYAHADPEPSSPGYIGKEGGIPGQRRRSLRNFFGRW